MDANHTPLVSEFADDPEMRDLVQMFIDELPDRMAGIEQALDAGDFQNAATLSHQLKGAAGGYGFPTITDAASEVETSAVTEDQAKAYANLKILKNLCARAAAE